MASLQRIVELSYERGEQTPWTKTVSTCDQLFQRSVSLWTFLETQGRYIWEFPEQAWIAHHPGGVMPPLLPDP